MFKYHRPDKAGVCTRCGNLAAERYRCETRWSRVLDVIRAEREENAELKEANADLEDQAELDGRAMYACGRLVDALRVALGSENVFDEGPDLFRIRRLMEDFEKERFD